MDTISNLPVTEVGSQEAFPDSPYRKSRNTIDLNFTNLTYRVKVKNPNRKGKGGPKCNFQFQSDLK